MNNNETRVKWYVFSKALTLSHNSTVHRKKKLTLANILLQ